MALTFRLFVSSTFNDFKQERRVLQEEVFPEIDKYCLGKKATFQPIDLRWGVSDETQLDQKTLDLCLNEVRNCKKKPYPNFLVMLGDRYGWIPLPYFIEQKEYELIHNQGSPDEQSLLNTWYKLDKNQIPASYRLQPREGQYEDFNNWNLIETQIRHIFQRIVSLPQITEKLTSQAYEKYFTSATESEIIEGVLPYKEISSFQQALLQKELKNLHFNEQDDAKNIFAFYREVDKTTALDNTFVEEIENPKVNELKQELAQHLLPENLLNIKNIQQTQEGLLEESYLEEFKARVTVFLKNKIDEMLALQKANGEDVEEEELTLEQQQNRRYKEEKLTNFIETPVLNGLEQQIQDYLAHQNNSNNESEENKALVIYGSSGTGKSAFMASVINKLEQNLTSETKLVYRFVGATPKSIYTEYLLDSIFTELGLPLIEDKEEEKIALGNSQEQKNHYQEFCFKALDVFRQLGQRKENIVIFIDALDQLKGNTKPDWLPAQLPQNVKVVISALEDNSYKEDSGIFESLKPKAISYSIPEFNQDTAWQLAKTILEQEHRTITAQQKAYFLNQYAHAKTPFYVLLAAEEMKYWTSYDDMANCQLNNTNASIAQEFIENLKTIHHQSPEFIQKVFAFLNVSQGGLSEYELLKTLNTIVKYNLDTQFKQATSESEYHENVTQSLPFTHWSRLQTALSPFIHYVLQDNEELMEFFHREFKQAVNTLYNKETQIVELEILIKSIQKILPTVADKDFNSNRWGKLYGHCLSEYYLLTINSDNLPEATKKLEEFSTYLLTVEDYKTEDWLTFLGKQYGIYHLSNHAIKACSWQYPKYCFVKHLYQQSPEQWMEDYTISLNNLASSLGKVGEVEKAIKLEKEALEICKKAYKQSPEQWMGDYTAFLNNLAGSLEKVGQVDKAIKLFQEALEIRKKAYEQSPEQWMEAYATSLNNLAAPLGKVGQVEKAIELDQEALEIRKKAYKQSPEQWMEAYTGSLNNLAHSLGKVGQIEKAIELHQKALDIRKKGYEQSPEQWMEAYTRSLNNLAMSLEKVGQVEKAIKLHQEALDIRKKAYEQSPEQWMGYYTTSLNNLALSLDKLGQVEKAIELYQKVLVILEKAYKQSPDQWMKYYTSSLHNLAGSLYTVGQVEKAIELLQEALVILEKGYEQSPELWMEDYMSSLNNLASSLREVGQVDKAIELRQKALDILKKGYEQSPELWKKDYTSYLNALALSGQVEKAIELFQEAVEIKAHTTSLNNLASSLREVGQVDKAIELHQKALDILKKGYEQYPKQWMEDYASSLNNLADSLETVGEVEKAIELYQEALEIRKKGYKQSPEQWMGDYTSALNNLASSLGKVGQVEKAIELHQEALVILEKAYKQSPEQWMEAYTRSLSHLAYTLGKVGQVKEAIELNQEALEICKKGYEQSPEQWVGDYSLSLNNLAFFLEKVGQLEKAIELNQEALEILKKAYKQSPEQWMKGYTISLNNLAVSLFKIGQVESAISQFELAWHIYTKHLGKEHPETIQARNYYQEFKKWYEERN